ncbi:porin OmpA [Crenobacter sp. SG2303]|uniref:Porin OmpA n=1 Tax=Crenobacter oryzisoli TaxID=3056844 RepID=A0ABT7XNU5_9NEIS|nr:porin OmpA [Crenobacter sp. SG2303]MDN0075469.1 porin OmpA [Crenobacter sp. SG2303]
MQKRIKIALLLAGLASVPAAMAASTDEPWYVGGKVGWSNWSNQRYSDAIQNPYDVNKDTVGGGVFLGYQINQWLGIEGGYDYFDKLKYSATNLAERQDFKGEGIQLTAKLGMPIAEGLDLYTRLGGMGTRGKGLGESKDVFSPLAALGLEYQFNRNWATRFEYQWTGNLGDKDKVGLKTDNNLVSVGLLYKFGGAPAPVPVAAPAPTPAPAPAAVAPHEYNLSSDVLFDFNKATLKPSGQTALAELMHQLQAETSREANITVVGHADRLGSEKYNLGLSRRRAQTVANYLIGHGIPANQVSVEGVGESEPVTGSQCDGIKKRAQLINCLAPDRRVVVKVSGQPKPQ